MARVRKAAHAGSWYTSNSTTLATSLDEWMDAADAELGPNLPGARFRALIAPHAGYRFSGRTAGYAYAALRGNAAGIKRVYVLGPSHHVYSKQCMLTAADTLETPVGALPVDTAEVKRLSKLSNFTTWDALEDDENEHSIEMQLPYIRRALKDNTSVVVVPICVGNLSHAQENEVGKVIGECLADESNVAIISSDFCHWGARFRYQFRLDTSLPIHRSIQQLDNMGMSIIETKDHDGFSSYLKTYKNTICGRHPIGILLGALEEMDKTGYNVKFVHYEQSSACTSLEDSSVSYASALVYKA